MKVSSELENDDDILTPGRTKHIQSTRTHDTRRQHNHPHFHHSLTCHHSDNAITIITAANLFLLLCHHHLRSLSPPTRVSSTFHNSRHQQDPSPLLPTCSVTASALMLSFETLLALLYCLHAAFVYGNSSFQYTLCANHLHVGTTFFFN